MEKMFTEYDVEAAMCLWEAFLDRVRNDQGDPIKQKLEAHLDGNGYAQTRMHVLDQAQRCNEEWAKLGDASDGMSFDWDFCPAFIHRLVEEGYFD